MLSERELREAIAELENGKTSYQNAEKLAHLYGIYDHLYSTNEKEKVSESVVGYYGSSEFLKMVANKSSEEVWLLIDELMTTLSVINHRLYDSVMRRLKGQL